MVKEFQLTGFPKVYFGEGQVHRLPQLLKSWGPWVLVLTGKQSFVEGPYWEKLKEGFAKEGILWSHAIIDREPSPLMIDEIANDHRDNVVDAVVAIGGGSVLDAGKAISAMLCERGSVKDYLEGVGSRQPSGEKVPFIAIPTTSGTGSEATKNAVITESGEGGFKKSLRHDNFIPDAAIIDPTLTLSLNPKITAYTGMDTFTQLLEAYVSTKATPLTDALALQGLEYVKTGLERVVEDGQDLEARSYMAYAAFLSGVCLANAGLGLVHGFASAVGARVEIPHGIVCARLMETVNRATVDRLFGMDQSLPVVEKYEKVGKIFGYQSHVASWAGEFLISEIQRLVRKFEVPRFAEFELSSEDLSAVVEKSSLKNHPIHFEREKMYEMLKLAL